MHATPLTNAMILTPRRGHVVALLLVRAGRVVKSRLQAGHAHALRYKSALDGLLTIVKEEGIEGLYKGVGSKLTQSVLTAAILFASQKRIFELTKQVRSSSVACSYSARLLISTFPNPAGVGTHNSKVTGKSVCERFE